MSVMLQGLRMLRQHLLQRMRPELVSLLLRWTTKANWSIPRPDWN